MIVPGRASGGEHELGNHRGDRADARSMWHIRHEGTTTSRYRVVCPALTSPVRHWVSDLDGARAQAQQRLDQTLSQLHAVGIEAQGEIGDEDPLRAIEDVLRTFGADEIIISTHPEGRSNWLERHVVTRARERLALPITHIVIDTEAGVRLET